MRPRAQTGQSELDARLHEAQLAIDGNWMIVIPPPRGAELAGADLLELVSPRSRMRLRNALSVLATGVAEAVESKLSAQSPGLRFRLEHDEEAGHFLLGFWNERNAVIGAGSLPLRGGAQPLSPDAPDTAAVGFDADTTQQPTQPQESEWLSGSSRLQTSPSENIGRLAAGIAHDFNNLLGVIAGSAELLLTKRKNLTPTSHDLSQILEAASRARDLASQLLLIGQDKPTPAEPVRLDEKVAEACEFLRRAFPAGVHMEFDIEHDRGAVVVQPSSIHQILLNLGLNALDAVDDYGVIRIALRRVELSRSSPARPEACLEGTYGCLTVEDDGQGMAPETLAHVFEPNFSTKGEGRGSGLGLSVVHSIVTDAGGHIEVQSRPGVGTFFRIYLPLIEMSFQEEPTGEVPARPGIRVLYVEDDQVLSEVGARVLQSLGCIVTVFDDAWTAVTAFSKAPLDFDVVVADLNMPSMSGKQLLDKLRLIDPSVCGVITSGRYLRLEPGTGSEAPTLLPKPWTRGTVAEALDIAMYGPKKTEA